MCWDFNIIDHKMQWMCPDIKGHMRMYIANMFSMERIQSITIFLNLSICMRFRQSKGECSDLIAWWSLYYPGLVDWWGLRRLPGRCVLYVLGMGNDSCLHLVLIARRMPWDRECLPNYWVNTHKRTLTYKNTI